MTVWAPRRFWTATGVARAPGGHAVALDGRTARTPAGAPLVLPTRALARALAAEWDDQQEIIEGAAMPLTRIANTAIDHLATRMAEVAAVVAAYGETDLLCHRAEAPAALAARQAEGWDPWLRWAEADLGAALRIGAGVLPIAQPKESLARLRARIAGFSAFELAPFHDLVAISGSLVLALAVLEGRLSPARAFALSRIDEHWQADQWGHDAEARAKEARHRAAFLAAAGFLALCPPDPPDERQEGP